MFNIMKNSDLFLKKMHKKVVLTANKKINLSSMRKKKSQRRARKSLTLNSVITCQCSSLTLPRSHRCCLASRRLLTYFGVLHSRIEIRAIFDFSLPLFSLSLAPTDADDDDDVEKFIYFSVVRSRRRNLSMSGMLWDNLYYCAIPSRILF